MTKLSINSERMRADFDALAQFGSTGDGGVQRPSLSETHLAARRWLREQIEKVGMEFRIDGAGNHSAFLKSPNYQLPITKTLLVGSHTDSVPYGGRFDGALGVVAALEVLRVLKENNIELSMNLEAMDFTDEEGTLVGLLGSSAVGGHLRAEHLQKPRGGRDAFEAGLARAGLTEQGMLSVERPARSLAGYLELHIEQGNRLINAQKNIGIVTAIVGIMAYRLKFIGRADHAGTTSMQDRRDAGQGASAFTLAAREIVLKDFPRCVANVGKMEFAPGGFNIVPASVVVSLEFRAPSDDEIVQLDHALIERAKLEAERFNLGLEIEFLGKHSPTPMSQVAQKAFADACDELGLSHMPLVSGAGHDAQSLAHLCPVGMIFVPSVNGASHSPREFTEWCDCVNGANVLLQAALRMAGGAA
ncbi:MAG: Zn-dependent hydrolase [Chloroflexi bacterium]|nr:Zn-dependent hydrolase [Chloroflexota bacterium]